MLSSRSDANIVMGIRRDPHEFSVALILEYGSYICQYWPVDTQYRKTVIIL